MKVTVNTEGGSYTVENDSVENIRDLLAVVQESLNVPAGVTPLLNGAPASEDATLSDDDEVSFTKPAGRKG